MAWSARGERLHIEQQHTGREQVHHELDQDPVVAEQPQTVPSDCNTPVSSDAKLSGTSTYQPNGSTVGRLVTLTLNGLSVTARPFQGD